MTSVVASKRSRCSPWLRALVASALLLAARGSARADPSPTDKATAQALFDDGRKLMKEKSYAEACPKLAESLRLDPALGTKLHLADCFEKNGQTASAWALFREAAEQAKIANQADRFKKATDRADALALRLCRLRIEVSVDAEITGVEVLRDNTIVGAASWGTSVPLDPGEHHIVAEAPGKKPFSTTVTLKDGETTPVLVLIPALEDLPKPVPAPAVVEPLKIEPPKIEPPQDPLKIEPPKIEPLKPPPRVPPPRPPVKAEPPKPTNAARNVGYVLTAVGGVGAGVGGVFGMVALVKNSDANPNCKHSNACNFEGTSDRSAALRFANISSVTLIAGGAVFAAGIITLIATREPEVTEKMVLKASPLIGAGTGGLLIEGSF
ncbi:MAG: hypothetical protein ABI193_21590 [Minicystis sp.]